MHSDVKNIGNINTIKRNKKLWRKQKMKKEIDKYMTIAEASERYDLHEKTIKERLAGRSKKGRENLEQLLEKGLVKYFKRQGGKRGEWIITTDAMEFWGYEEI